MIETGALNMYSFEGRIRYSEVDEDKKLSVSGIINYFQDCSTFQSEDIGLGFDFLEAHNRAWVLNAWQIVIKELPRFGEKVTIGTWPYGFQGFIGYRNFVLLNECQEILACANSVWAYLDTATGKFAKAGGYELERYKLEEKLAMDYADRKIKLAEGGISAAPIMVTEHQIDTNHHMNNQEYVKLALDLAEQKNPHQIRAEYKKSALLGDVIYPSILTNETEKTIVLADEKGKPYAIVALE